MVRNIVSAGQQFDFPKAAKFPNAPNEISGRWSPEFAFTNRARVAVAPLGKFTSVKRTCVYFHPFGEIDYGILFHVLLPP